jgi:membrane protease YdiL (CAAX protease family)
LTGSDKRWLLLWILFGALGLALAHHYFFRAFPEASVDFKISRGEALNRARDFVQGLGENLDGDKAAITFQVDDNAKTYLERELGLQDANRAMSSQLNIWFWEVRFFKPLQEEEFQVRVSPAGKVVAYAHKIEEARGMKSLSREEALASAQQFLQTKLGTNLNDWNFLPDQSNSEIRPNRLDWSFTWERKDFKAKGAPYRLEAGLQGDRIGSTQEYLQVPEAWTRSYDHLRSTNNLYESIALVPYGFMLGGAIWLGIGLLRQRKTSWTPAILVGGLVTGLYALMKLNEWSALLATYDTHDSYRGFVALRLFFVLLEAVTTGLTAALVIPGGEPLYRSKKPEKLRLYKAFSARGIRSKEFFCASVVGLSMAAAHMGFLVAFYIAATKLGAWAPQDLNYTDAVNTAFPWIAGIAIGVTAATSEEFLFRMFGIPFIEKLSGSRVLAVILPAFFWSFLHSNYPQEPGYVRGIEVGLIGIVAGLVMLRWGIVATLVWHYTVDASLVGLLLIRSDNLYFKISGIIVGLAAVVPLAWSGISYLARGSFEPVNDLLNSAEPTGEISLVRQTVATESAPSSHRYSALSAGTIGFLALCAVAGGVLAFTMKRQALGDYLHLSINARSAVARADDVMRQHQLDPGSFHRVAAFRNNTDEIVNEYLHRCMTIAQINEIYDKRVPGALWLVRYYRDSQPEEFSVVLRPDGTLHSFRHKLAEADQGENLSKEEARAIAEKFLTEQKKTDLSGWKLVEANSEKRPHRTDHTFTWQQNIPLDPVKPEAVNSNDHAYARMDVQVLGNEPTSYRTYIKIPEEFTRKLEEKSTLRIALVIGKFVLGIAIIVAVLVFYFKNLRAQPAGTTPWRRLLPWAACGVAGFALSFLLGKGIPVILASYQTAIPMRIFLATSGVLTFLGAAFLLGGLLLLFGLAYSFGVRAFGAELMPAWSGMPKNYYRDAFWIAIGGTAVLLALHRLLGAADGWWPTQHRGFPASFGDTFDAIFPAAAVVGGAVERGLYLLGTFALAAAFLGSELRVRWLRLILFFVLAAALVPDWGSPADFLKQFLGSVVILGVVVFGMRNVVRFNLLGFFLVVASLALLGGAVELLAQADSFYRAQAYLILGALVLLLGWPLVAWRMSSANNPGA